MGGFPKKFEHKSLANPTFLILTTILLVVGYTKNDTNKLKTDEWLGRKSAWEQANPEPREPKLKHFHGQLFVVAL